MILELAFDADNKSVAFQDFVRRIHDEGIKRKLANEETNWVDFGELPAVDQRMLLKLQITDPGVRTQLSVIKPYAARAGVDKSLADHQADMAGIIREWMVDEQAVVQTPGGFETGEAVLDTVAEELAERIVKRWPIQ